MKRINKKSKNIIDQYEFVYNRFLSKKNIIFNCFYQSEQDKYSNDLIRLFMIDTQFSNKKSSIYFK